MRSKFAIALVLATVAIGQAQNQYTAQRLATFSSASSSDTFPAIAYGVNDNEVVVGECTTNGELRAFAWDQSGTHGIPARSFRAGSLQVGGLGQGTSFHGISGNQAIGYLQRTASARSPLVCTNVLADNFSLNYLTLGTGASFTSGEALQSNRGESGNHIVGYVKTSGGVERAAYWDSQGSGDSPQWESSVNSFQGRLEDVALNNTQSPLACGTRGTSTLEAFVLTCRRNNSATNITALPKGAYSQTRAHGISPDGVVIVGRVLSGSTWVSAYWWNNGNWNGPYPWSYEGVLLKVSNPVAATGNGYMAVGYFDTGGGNRALVTTIYGPNNFLVLDLNDVTLDGYETGSRRHAIARDVANSVVGDRYANICGQGSDSGRNDAVVLRSAIGAANRAGGLAIGSVQMGPPISLQQGGVLTFTSYLSYSNRGNPLHENRTVGISNSRGFPMSSASAGNGLAFFRGQADTDGNGSGGVRQSEPFTLTVPPAHFGEDIYVNCNTNEVGFDQTQFFVGTVPKENVLLQEQGGETEGELGQSLNFNLRVFGNSVAGYTDERGGVPLTGIWLTQAANLYGFSNFNLNTTSTGSPTPGVIDGGGYFGGTCEIPMSTAPGTYQSRYSTGDNGRQNATTFVGRQILIRKIRTTFTQPNIPSAQVGDLVQASVRLQRVRDGVAIPGQQVEFKDNGVSLGVVATDGSGVATILYRISNQPVGIKNLTANHLPDQYHEATGTANCGINVLNSAPSAGLQPASLALFNGLVGFPADKYVGYPNGVTVEGWALQREQKVWARLFEFSAGVTNNPVDYFYWIPYSTLGNNYAGFPGNNTYFNPAFPLSTWTHFAFTVTPTGLAQFYLNGQLVSQAQTASYPAFVQRTIASIGGSSTSNDPQFAGSVADFRIWNSVKSVAEIQEDQRTYLKGTEADIVAALRLNQATGASIPFANNPSISTTRLGTTIWLNGVSQIQYFDLDSTGNNPLPPLGFDANLSALTFELISGPTKGVLTGTYPNLGYDPGATFDGLDQFTFRVRDPQNAASANTVVYLRSQQSTAQIPVYLQDLNVASDATPISYQVLNAANAIVDSGSASLQGGQIQVNTATVGTVRVRVKGPTWLSKRTSNLTMIAGQTITSPSVSLGNGDCNNDNIVDLTDYTIVVLAFNYLYGEAGYDPQADLNKDNAIDLTDYTIVIIAFNGAGD